jgi:hypothetical protein
MTITIQLVLCIQHSSRSCHHIIALDWSSIHSHFF